MQYELPPDVEQQVRERMASGHYATEVDVLRDALAALKSRDEELTAIQEGIDDMEAGRVRPFDEVDFEIRKQFGFADEP
jgi:Arc/MetJ-type ribon-helix-helix transcriptional regulator